MPLSKLVGRGIGLAQETTRRSRSASSSGNSQPRAEATPWDRQPSSSARQPSPSAGPSQASFEGARGDTKDQKFSQEKASQEKGPQDNDNLDWALDDAVREVEEDDPPPPYEEGAPPPSIDSLVNTFVARHPVPAMGSLSSSRLPAPVILPQRRPKTRSRGFVRAYAPDLDRCGIDQGMWMDFLDSFDKSMKLNPAFYVANLAAVGLHFVPVPGATGIAIAFNRLVSATRNVQQSRQQNHFIDDMNEKLFKPRGLYCMIMSYQPHSKSSGEIFNINKAIETATSRDQQTGVTKTMGNMRAADGTTRGELEMPPSAELIYPDLDQEEEDEVKQGFWEGKKTLAADYFDRRAQAEFNAQNPNSSLAPGQQPQFVSRYSDPNHPAVNNGFIGLLTGGALAPRDRRRERRQARKEQRGDWRQARGRGRQGPVARRQMRRQQNPGLIGGARQTIRRSLGEGVIYLMVANLPTAEEEQEARKLIA